LQKGLAGIGWEQVPASFVDFNSGSLPLMEPGALVQFVPAWLLRSLDTLSDESVVAEFTMYFFCPGNADEGWDQARITELVALFDPAQRSLIAEFLRGIAESKMLDNWHPFAEYGLKWWAA